MFKLNESDKETLLKYKEENKNKYRFIIGIFDKTNNTFNVKGSNCEKTFKSILKNEDLICFFI